MHIEVDRVDARAAAYGADGERCLRMAGNNDLVTRERELPSVRVEADLRRRIGAGEWQAGESLPPVSQLAEEYGVARNTITKAMRKLVEDGLIEIVPNWGTFRAG